MLSFDSDSDSEDGKSWISMKSLKEAADIKTLYRKPPPKLAVSQSPNTSVTMECLPHTTTNQSISFSYLHEQYRTCAEDYFQGVELPSIKIDTSFGEDPAPSLQKEFDILKCESSVHRSRRKLANEPTARFREEIAELRSQLHIAHQEIDRLRKELTKKQQSFAIQLQELQEHHERKQQKIRKDIETLGGVDLSQVREEHQRALDAIRDKYEEKLEEMKVEHELEFQEKEDQCEKIIENMRVAAGEQKRFYEKMMEERRKTESGGNEQELQRTLKEQSAMIADQARTITELKQQLQSTLRRSTPRPLTTVFNKENLSLEPELRSILKQINSHLDSSELSSSDRSLSGTLGDLRNKLSAR